MQWEAPLRTLVEAGYRAEVTALVDRPPHAPAGRRHPGAFTGQVREWLLQQAAVLDFVEARGFPAPGVVRGGEGQPVAAHGDC